jgi:cation:H+ antiporter
MDFTALAISVAAVVGCSLGIWKACDFFEIGSRRVGQNMPPGVRGATINAIGSSLPELLTTFCLLVFFLDEDGFSGAIATCAGSAVFNAIIIPAACIFAVTVVGIKNKQGGRMRAQSITVGRGTVLRDGAFFIMAELVLIYFLGGSTMVWWMGGVLMTIYLGYFTYLMVQYKLKGTEPDDDDEEEGCSLTKAWTLLGLSTTAIGLFCYVLSWAVVEAAHALDVPLYFTTVILAAGATSVPDTVLSVKDAMQGDFDDAVSNAMGSNIFDITVALGLPLFVFGLINGDVSLSASGSAADVQILRIALLVMTALTLGIFLIGKTMGKPKAGILLVLYIGWTVFIIGRAIGA